MYHIYKQHYINNVIHIYKFLYVYINCIRQYINELLR
jgi:hypothetical protein